MTTLDQPAERCEEVRGRLVGGAWKCKRLKHDDDNHDWYTVPAVDGAAAQRSIHDGFTKALSPKPDMVSHPPHYTGHPSGIECITVVEHLPFLRGNAIKYLWRAGSKGGQGQEIEDLRKAVWYIQREIANIEGRLADEQGEQEAAER